MNDANPAALLARFAAPIVETVRQPLLLLSTDLKVVLANRGYYRTFRTQESATVGESVFDVLDGAWNRDSFKEVLAQVIQRQPEVRDFEITCTMPSIGRRDFLIDARRLDDPTHAADFILLAFEDRTAQLAAVQLSRDANLELSRSNQELEEFASIASHDLQEPLRKIRAFGERLEARAAGALDDTSRDFLRRMLNAAERMSRLIDDVLTVARVGHGQLTFAPVDLNALVAEIAGSDRAIVAQQLPSVVGDPGQLRQLFENLIDNARKFQRPDAASAIAVTASPAERDGYVAITVADNGIGIAPEYTHQIFGMFRRLHGTAQYPGTGIGLALCRRIVERHGGTIAVESVLGKGSRFIVQLRRHSGNVEGA